MGLIPSGVERAASAVNSPGHLDVCGLWQGLGQVSACDEVEHAARGAVCSQEEHDRD